MIDSDVYLIILITHLINSSQTFMVKIKIYIPCLFFVLKFSLVKFYRNFVYYFIHVLEKVYLVFYIISFSLIELFIFQYGIGPKLLKF